MAESHEPSYYEIALTNRQVVVAFVILLVCLLSAFFSGVWIGRESTARAAERQIVQNEAPQIPQEGQNLEELEFFDSRGNDPEESDPQETPAPAQPSADTTLLEDFSGEPAAGPSAAGEGEPVAEAAAGEEEPAAPEPEPGRRERRNRRRQRQAEEAAAEPAAAPAVTVPQGAVVIQVFSSADRAKAESTRQQLAGGGYQAYLAPIERGGRTMYRVRIGPFASREDAQKAADKVRREYKLDTWVTE